MESVCAFFVENMNWIFSGIGVAILSFIVGYFQGRARDVELNKKVRVSRGNIRIQMGDNISHGFGVGKKTDAEIFADFKSLKEKSEKPNEPKKNHSKAN